MRVWVCALTRIARRAPQLLRGLHSLHTRGITHRDVKARPTPPHTHTHAITIIQPFFALR